MKRNIILIAILLLITGTFNLEAQVKKYSTQDDEVSFDGNDLTEYQNKKVVKGKKEHILEYDGLTLLFASAENRNKFQSNPDKYLPAYKGWCATAVANGSLYKPDYSHFKIQDEKLLFFEVRAFFNGKTACDKYPVIHMIQSDEKFKSLAKN